MKEIKLTICGLLLYAGVAIGQVNSYPTTGDAAIKSGKLLLETNVWRESLLTFTDTHYGPIQLYKFQIESDGLKIRQDNNVNYMFRSGGDFIINRGFVGIGTEAPTNRLEIFGSTFNRVSAQVNADVQNGFQLKRTGTNATDWEFYTPSGTPNLRFYNSNYGDVLTMTHTGNIGIGTTTPGSKLTVKESPLTQGLIITNVDVLGYQSHFGFTTANQSSIGAASESYLNYYNDGKWNINSGNTSGSTLPISFDTDGQSRLFIKPDGNIGIGTTDPKSYKLAVNGKIWATEVQVALTIPGPDYVFEDTYSLPSLADTETYIKQNKHLPEVPSACEMEKKGINLSEMNMLLLKKVEELTLYVIELKKENIEIKKLINEKQ